LEDFFIGRKNGFFACLLSGTICAKRGGKIRLKKEIVQRRGKTLDFKFDFPDFFTTLIPVLLDLD
jgi:hypothetical protein